MRVDIPGFIDDRILMFGSRQVTSYLVMGKCYAWIGGGTAWGVHRLEEQLDRFRIDRSRIRHTAWAMATVSTWAMDLACSFSIRRGIRDAPCRFTCRSAGFFFRAMPFHFPNAAGTN